MYIGIINSSQNNLNTSPYSSEYLAVYNAMTNKPTESIALAQDEFVKALVLAGIWAKLDLLYLFAQYSNASGEAQINWKNPGTYNCVNAGSATFTALEGFTGNGSSMYLTTGFIPSVNAVQLTLDSASVGVYTRVNETSANPTIAAVSASPQNAIQIVPKIADGRTAIKINNATVSNYQSTTNSLGFFVGSRNSSTEVKAYRNASLLSTTTTTSVAIPSGELNILRHDVFALYSTQQVSCVFLGAALNQTEVTAFNTAIETYMDSNSKGVE